MSKAREPKQNQRRSIPAIGRLLDHHVSAALCETHSRARVTEALRQAVTEARPRVEAGDTGAAAPAALVGRAEELLAAEAVPSLRPVINATGVVLHTGLGRAPLAVEALHAVVRVAQGYCNLEFELDRGQRGRRVSHVASLLAELTGAEAATVVNNNAAATVLMLNTFARGAEVVVSRGQLVEIGGSFRMPDVMAASGAILREVGTTNRTRLADYEKAIGENTSALLRVHPSNYRIVGFTATPALEELVALARRYGKLCLDDLGSGALFSLPGADLSQEPTVRASIVAGADVVCFSGDKLLGGPQAGVLAGRRDLIQRLEANPLMRSYRVDKMTLAALEATLRLHRDEKAALTAIPALAMLGIGLDTLQRRARKLAGLLVKARPGDTFEIVADRSVAGGGSMPGEELETRCVAWRPPEGGIDEMLRRLRIGDPAIVARASKERILFDVRTLQGSELLLVARAVGGLSGD